MFISVLSARKRRSRLVGAPMLCLFGNLETKKSLHFQKLRGFGLESGAKSAKHLQFLS